ncbi:MAG TPA: universal stress protein [Steroidobacteraceae bacterium]|nr:universal stress protein [Steroidobacteraceae bacterium]
MYKQLLVPVDGSEPSMLGLAEAIKIAKSDGSKLHLVHVLDELVPWGVDIPARYIEQFVDALKARGREVLGKAERTVREHALEPNAVLIETIGGRAADLIVEQAKQCRADLIVMGTHGRRGLRRLALGSDAELVLRSSSVPVLLVRGRAKDDEPRR